MTMLWSDAWVLTATLYAGQGKPASLASVIAAADYLNQAVLVVEEMQGALARLTEAGYLRFTDAQLAPTEKTLSYWAARPKRKKAYDELKDVAGFIGAPDWEPSSTPQQANVGVSFPGVSKKTFDEAVESYVGRHSKSRKK